MAIYVGNQKVNPSGIGKVYVGNQLIYQKSPTPVTYAGLCFTAQEANSTVELYNGDISDAAYSRDGITWISFTPEGKGTNVVTLTNIGDKVYFRSNINDDMPHIAFAMSGVISARGNINSLYDATNFTTLTTLEYAECYDSIFKDCTSLTTAPALPATTLSGWCYYHMFEGCSNLVSPPSLPATNLAENCYEGLFYNCTSLTTAPALPATSLEVECYASMFYGCTHLLTPPSLPASRVFSSCYYGMFSGCTSLTTAPDLLPALVLDEGCYSEMFSGCTSLTTAPTLPATTLTEHCYSEMFSGCTSLTTTPELPAMTLADSCYYSMFKNCTNLVTVPRLPSNFLYALCYAYMFEGCTSLQVSDTQTEAAPYAWRIPATDTLASTVFQDRMFAYCAGTRSSSSLPGARGQSYTYYTQNLPVGMKDYLCFTANIAGSTLELYQSSSGTPTITSTAYSTDGANWITFTPSTTIGTNTVILTNVGDKVYFKGVQTSSSTPLKFNMTGSIAVTGNIMSLCCGDNFENNLVLPYAKSFYALFDSCTALTSAPKLPATTLTDYCYFAMFRGCTSLQSAPELPAETMAYYCYERMFDGCRSLTTVSALPAMTLAQECYFGMFLNCTSLTTAPALPATQLYKSCYTRMFSNCTNLTIAPALPATTLATMCYTYMFAGCTNLNTVTVAFTDWSYHSEYGSATAYWLQGVASTGTFTCPTSLGTETTITRGDSNCPTNWAVTELVTTHLYIGGKGESQSVLQLEYNGTRYDVHTSVIPVHAGDTFTAIINSDYEDNIIYYNGRVVARGTEEEPSISYEFTVTESMIVRMVNVNNEDIEYYIAVFDASAVEYTINVDAEGEEWGTLSPPVGTYTYHLGDLPNDTFTLIAIAGEEDPLTIYQYTSEVEEETEVTSPVTLDLRYAPIDMSGNFDYDVGYCVSFYY